MKKLLLASALVSTVDGALITVFSGGSIQQAIDQSQDGDVIEVHAGTYNENIDFGGREVFLRSAEGPEETVINGGDSGTTVAIRDSAEISGFTITGGSNSFGGGLSVGGIGTIISGNIFSGNRGTGAAIWGNSASPVILGNIFRENSSDNQFLSAAVSFVNSSSPIIQNNVFSNNFGRGLNFTLPVGSSPVVSNNTFWGNTAAIRVDGRVPTSAITFQNNILGSNAIALEVDFFSSSFAEWNNNLLFDNLIDYDGITDFSGVDGNFQGDPMFVDSAMEDFRLLPDSSAVDAGLNALSPIVDFEGNRRPFDGDLDGISIVDIGAFEFVPEPSGLFLVYSAFFFFFGRRIRT